MSDPDPIGMYLYHPQPDVGGTPLTNLEPGARVYAVVPNDHTSEDDPWAVGDRVTVIPLTVGTPAQPVPPTRWTRLWCWLRRRPVPDTGEFTIQWQLP